MSENLEKELLKRFDAVIKLLTITAMKEESQKEKIILLNSVGFKPKEIADLLSTTNNSVSVALSNIKNKEKKDKIEAGKDLALSTDSGESNQIGSG